MNLYATRQNVLALVPRTVLSRPARTIDSVSGSVLGLAEHGLDTGDALTLSVSGDGVLPAPLAALTVYYALLIVLDDGTTDENRFQVSATKNGSAIDLVDVGTEPFSLVIPAGPTIDANIEYFSRWVDSVITGDVAPLAQPYPSWVVSTVALRAAIRTARAFGRSMPNLEASETDEVKDFMRMAANLPLRGDASAQLSANTAVVQSAGRVAQFARGRLP